jgi:hypothetical protein
MRNSGKEWERVRERDRERERKRERKESITMKAAIELAQRT